MRCDLAALQQCSIAAGELGSELGALLPAGAGAVQEQQIGPHLHTQLWRTALYARPHSACVLARICAPLATSLARGRRRAAKNCTSVLVGQG